MLIRNTKEHLSRDMFHCVSLCFIRINLIVTYSCFIVHSQSLEIVTYWKSTAFNDIQRSSTIAPVFFVETEKERFVFITFWFMHCASYINYLLYCSWLINLFIWLLIKSCIVTKLYVNEMKRMEMCWMRRIYSVLYSRLNKYFYLVRLTRIFRYTMPRNKKVEWWAKCR